MKFDEILKHDSVNDVLSKYSITSNQDENQIALIDFLDFKNKKNEDNIERESFLNISTEVTLTNKRNKDTKLHEKHKQIVSHQTRHIAKTKKYLV